MQILETIMENEGKQDVGTLEGGKLVSKVLTPSNTGQELAYLLTRGPTS
jgi:hypothetical protein